MKRSRKLLDEAQLLIIVLTVCIIIVVEILSLSLITARRIGELKVRNSNTADEIALLLIDPMYSVDDLQASRIVEALMSSGEISGIKLESSVSGSLIMQEPEKHSVLLPSQIRGIMRGDVLLGTVQLFFRDDEIITLRDQLLQMALAIIVAVALSSFILIRFFLLRRVRKTFESVSTGINSIASGDYTTVIELAEYGDLNVFITLVNDMAGKILVKNAELLEANTLLEKRVTERTSDLELTQKKLILSEKLSALGQLSAGIAHELNTPLGAILSSIGLLQDFTDTHLVHICHAFAEMDILQRKYFLLILESTLSEGLRSSHGNDRKQRKEIQNRLESENVSNAHQIAGLLGDMGVLCMYETLEPVIREPWFHRCLASAAEIVAARKMTEIINIAVNKSVIVVGALRSYLRDGPVSSLESVDIGTDIDTILMLIQNKIKNEVRIIRDYRSGPALGSSQSLSQVWLNLINNALQAMEYKGTLTLKTETVGDLVLVHIIDTGPGIPDLVRSHIFEPFFTTKKYGEGMGLGLDICKQIIEQFDGKIYFESRPGFTSFTVQLLLAK